MTNGLKNANVYHVDPVDPHITNNIRDEAFYALEHYYINTLHLKSPKLVHDASFAFHLNDPLVHPELSGDVIVYTEGPLLEYYIYKILMYVLECNVDSLHIALIVHEENPTLHKIVKQGCIESVEKYNRMKHWLRRYMLGNKAHPLQRLMDILKIGIGLSGTEYIPRRLPELILNTDIHVFESPGIMVL